MVNRNQITYFFGAGASCHAIPTVDGLSSRINNLIKYLSQIKGKIEGGNPKSFLSELTIKNNQTLIDIIQELNWLINESEEHQTVDTLAKKFYVQSDYKSLCKLKRALIIYFFFEQNIKFSNYSEEKNKHELLLDKRYDNLIANIAERKNAGVELKGHIKFITWNYDLQIDLALRNYFTGKTINRIKNENHIHPNNKSFDLENGQLIDINKFAVVKLNGNAFLDNGFDDGNHNGVTINDFRFSNNDSKNTDILGEFLLEYSTIFSNGLSGSHPVYKYFNFAWEKEDKYRGHKNVVSEAINIMNNTKVLIIVGYSFPFFNSEIDKQLFANCNPNEVIIQDLEPEKIKERVLQLLSENKVPFDKNKIKSVLPEKFFPIHPET
jgi:hypothetical protein